jgi:hypothetical protein
MTVEVVVPSKQMQTSVDDENKSHSDTDREARFERHNLIGEIRI